MAIYAIHAPPAANAAQAVDGARLLADGFCLAAFVFAPLWALANRLWLVLGLWVLALVGLQTLAAFGWLNPGGAAAIYLLGALLTGLEGRGWLAAKFARHGAPLADIVAAPDAEEAARRYFERAVAQKPAQVPNPLAARAPAPIIGLFPEAQP